MGRHDDLHLILFMLIYTIKCDIYISVNENTTIFLNCGSNPTIKSKWLDPTGADPTSSDRFSLAANGSLLINHVRRYDAGLYRCSSRIKTDHGLTPKSLVIYLNVKCELNYLFICFVCRFFLFSRGCVQYRTKTGRHTCICGTHTHRRTHSRARTLTHVHACTHVHAHAQIHTLAHIHLPPPPPPPHTHTLVDWLYYYGSEFKQITVPPGVFVGNDVYALMMTHGHVFNEALLGILSCIFGNTVYDVTFISSIELSVLLQ